LCCFSWLDSAIADVVFHAGFDALPTVCTSTVSSATWSWILPDLALTPTLRTAPRVVIATDLTHASGWCLVPRADDVPIRGQQGASSAAP